MHGKMDVGRGEEGDVGGGEAVFQIN